MLGVDRGSMAFCDECVDWEGCGPTFTLCGTTSTDEQSKRFVGGTQMVAEWCNAL